MTWTKEKQREYYRAWYARNKEKAAEAGRQWRAENKDRCRGYERKRRIARNVERRARGRNVRLRRNYGLTTEQWDAIFRAQGHACANPSCKRTDPGIKRGWHTDHCHETGAIRGILCGGCNVALGHARDSVEVLRGLADYLERHHPEKTLEP